MSFLECVKTNNQGDKEIFLNISQIVRFSQAQQNYSFIQGFAPDTDYSECVEVRLTDGEMLVLKITLKDFLKELS